jgi:hypothetical protein
MKIFHLIPPILHVSGGIKVHFQLAELERELGYESYVVYPDGTMGAPSWFRNTVPFINISIMNKLANRQKDVIIGWEKNEEDLYRSMFLNKVMYIQGHVFIDRSKPYYGLDIWFSSVFNQIMSHQFSEHRHFLISPFIDFTRFNFDPTSDVRTTKLLVQERKGGHEAITKLRAADERGHLRDIQDMVKFVPDVSEERFAEELRNAQFFFAHSYPEGLGLCPLEAMACGALVVGFSGGGGSDFMQPMLNSFIVPDGDYPQLASLLYGLFSGSLDSTREESVRAYAVLAAQRYSRERTKEQLRQALSIYE